MPLSMHAISIIGRLHPEIFDILGTPTAVVGRYRSRADLAALNPQPLPPGPPEALLTGVRAADTVRITARGMRTDTREGRATTRTVKPAKTKKTTKTTKSTTRRSK